MRITLLAVIALTLVSHHAAAESAREKGERIAREAGGKDRGYKDYSATGNMILRTASGRQSKRNFVFRFVEGKKANKSILTFDWPGDIRNTSLLTHAYKKRDDLQWVYLPSVRRVKRISSKGRSGSFVGSEFSFEDMVDQEASKYDHLWIAEETCPNISAKCHVIERRPKFKSGYTKQVAWFDVGRLKLRAVEYYNKRKEKAKTLHLNKYKSHQGGKYFQPGELIMSNHLNKKTTILHWQNYRFDVGLSEKKFTERELKRLR